jgi:proton-translocating NAD(P)+ transhydrogenase subunit alpha
MKLAVLKERLEGEPRVAATPDTVKRFGGIGLEVTVESGAGESSGVLDAAYRAAGANIARSPEEAAQSADIMLKVRGPTREEIAPLKSGAVLVGLMSPYAEGELIGAYAQAGLLAFAMELLPRISRAQAMDVLSSQSNLAGYRAVIDAASAIARAFPMMMTAAGTVPPARVLVMGAGVAGLQAIATARRLGAIVSATDVRPAAKEQVESLGGTFVAVIDEEFKQAETVAGYAREMSKDYQAKQAALIAQAVLKQDVIITTALIPGRPAPRLVSAEMVASMKPGSVIVDLAVEQGGNVEGSRPGETVMAGNVKILGYRNVPGRVANDASMLYAKNLWNFLSPLIDKESKTLKIDWSDEIIAGTLLTRDGAVVHKALAQHGL